MGRLALSAHAPLQYPATTVDNNVNVVHGILRLLLLPSSGKNHRKLPTLFGPGRALPDSVCACNCLWFETELQECLLGPTAVTPLLPHNNGWLAFLQHHSWVTAGCCVPGGDRRDVRRGEGTHSSAPAAAF